MEEEKVSPVENGRVEDSLDSNFSWKQREASLFADVSAFHHDHEKRAANVQEKNYRVRV